MNCKQSNRPSYPRDQCQGKHCETCGFGLLACGANSILAFASQHLVVEWRESDAAVQRISAVRSMLA
eukprot:1293809-Amphidinium_carterae.1